MRFTLKTLDGLRIFRDGLGKKLQRDAPVEAYVFGFVDHPRSSTAQSFQDAECEMVCPMSESVPAMVPYY